jgi:hypothetical protein
MKSNRMAALGGVLGVAATCFVFAQDKSAQKAQFPSVTPQNAGISGSATNPAATSDYPVIGYIEKRDRTITIKAGPRGTLYSVATKDGKVLCKNLSEEQLRAEAPELHEFIKTAGAGSAGKNGAAIDARVRPQADARVR